MFNHILHKIWREQNEGDPDILWCDGENGTFSVATIAAKAFRLQKILCVGVFVKRIWQSRLEFQANV